MLLENVWGPEYAADTPTLRVHVSHLRQKLGELWGHRLIKTIRGVGYMLVADPKSP